MRRPAVRSGKRAAYPAYKPSGMEWVGDIPGHWEVRRVKYTADLINVKVDGTDNDLPYTGLEHIESWTGRRVATNGDVRGEGLANLYRCGDVLFGKLRPYLAKAHAADSDGICTGELLVLRPRAVAQKFLLDYVLNPDFIAVVDSSTYGAKMPRANWDFIGNLPALIPPSDEQQAITTFLDRETARIDTLIEKKHRQIELLQEKRSALISHAVTKGLDPNAKMKDSGIEWLGEIPAHWEQKAVKRMTRMLRGKFSHRPRNDPRMYDGPYPFVQTGDVAGAQKYITGFNQTLNEDGLSVSKMFPRGTLVMTIAANIGDMAVLDFEACFPDSIVGFVPNKDLALDYLYYLFIGMKPALLGTATLNTQLNLNIDRIGSLVTAHPTMDEQRRIVQYLENETLRIDTLSAKVDGSITMLREYRAALISATVTGKIDVRTMPAGRQEEVS